MGNKSSRDLTAVDHVEGPYNGPDQLELKEYHGSSRQKQKRAWANKYGIDDENFENTLDPREKIMKLTLPRFQKHVFGFTFVGPDQGQRVKKGIFITRSRKDLPGDVGELRRGHEVLSLNDREMSGLSKQEAAEIIRKTPDFLRIELKYNPEGFSSYDFGEELRRCTKQDFTAGVTVQELREVQEFKGVYMGWETLTSSSDLSELQQAFKVLSKKKKQFIKIDLLIKVDCTQVKKEGSNQVHQLIELVDIVQTNASGTAVAIVANQHADELTDPDVTPAKKTTTQLKKMSKRTPICHIIKVKNKKMAIAVAHEINTRCQRGKMRVKECTERRQIRLGFAEAKRQQDVENRKQAQKIADENALRQASIRRKVGELPITKQTYYTSSTNYASLHQSLLKKARPSTFFVCPHPKPDTFYLFVKEDETVSKYIIASIPQDDRSLKFKLATKDDMFDSVVDLVRFYQLHPYNVTSQGAPLTLLRSRQSQTASMVLDSRHDSSTSKQSSDRSDVDKDETSASNELSKEEHAAVVIQANFRGFRDRKKLDEMKRLAIQSDDEDEEEAATDDLDDHVIVVKKPDESQDDVVHQQQEETETKPDQSNEENDDANADQQQQEEVKDDQDTKPDQQEEETNIKVDEITQEDQIEVEEPNSPNLNAEEQDLLAMLEKSDDDDDVEEQTTVVVNNDEEEEEEAATVDDSDDGEKPEPIVESRVVVVADDTMELEENEAEQQQQEEAKNAMDRIGKMRRSRRRGTANNRKAAIEAHMQAQNHKSEKSEAEWMEELRELMKNTPEYRNAAEAQRQVMLKNRELKDWHQKQLEIEEEFNRKEEEERKLERLEQERKEKLRQEEEEKKREKEQERERRMSFVPKLDKERFRKYATEQERLDAETNIEESNQRLNEINFNFTFG